ncbi:MAG: dihydropteroate synthase [Acidimicrobiales bacterium]
MCKLRLGGRHYDLTDRALVMGILNRTPDSFFDKGLTFELDALLKRSEQLVHDGADILDIGGVKAGPGPFVSAAEELDRVVGAVAEVCERFDVPVSVDTWRASVAKECFRVGAVMGNDISGFADPDYLKVVASASASVVATHIRLAPRVADPEPHYEDLLGEVTSFLRQRTERALEFGVADDRIVIDVGLDLGKTAEQSLVLLRRSDSLTALGFPLLLSASNKTFLGTILGLDIGDRRDASLAAAALGIARGCRLVRVHDVAGTVRVRNALAAIAGQAR